MTVIDRRQSTIITKAMEYEKAVTSTDTRLHLSSHFRCRQIYKYCISVNETADLIFSCIGWRDLSAPVKVSPPSKKSWRPCVKYGRNSAKETSDCVCLPVDEIDSALSLLSPSQGIYLGQELVTLTFVFLSTVLFSSFQ